MTLTLTDCSDSPDLRAKVTVADEPRTLQYTGTTCWRELRDRYVDALTG